MCRNLDELLEDIILEDNYSVDWKEIEELINELEKEENNE